MEYIDSILDHQDVDKVFRHISETLARAATLRWVSHHTKLVDMACMLLACHKTHKENKAVESAFTRVGYACAWTGDHVLTVSGFKDVKSQMSQPWLA
jgi:hypothetical protein